MTEELKMNLEKQIADHDIRSIGITVGVSVPVMGDREDLVTSKNNSSRVRVHLHYNATIEMRHVFFFSTIYRPVFAVRISNIRLKKIITNTIIIKNVNSKYFLGNGCAATTLTRKSSQAAALPNCFVKVWTES